VAVDFYEQTLVAYVDDTPVFATLISSGLPPNETNEGLFEIWEELPVRPHLSGSTGAPDAYALQSVPWVMYFDGALAYMDRIGTIILATAKVMVASDMTISDAKWLYNWLKPIATARPSLPPRIMCMCTAGEYGQPAGNAARSHRSERGLTALARPVD
jgi:hypothetical protein